MSIVSRWFGNAFSQLHPRLQQLHLEGGVLSGKVNIQYGVGLAGFIGRRLGKKLGLFGAADLTPLVVTISHDKDCLYWNRVFGGNSEMTSTFSPVGVYPQGRWIETTGVIAIEMEVDIRDQGWYWKPVAYKVWGVTMPSFLFPISNAYKKIVDESYHFSVDFSFPLLGSLLRYSGSLEQKL